MALLARSIVVVFFLILGVAAAGKENQVDGRILLSFKESADYLNVALRSWEGHSPCSGGWVGVACYRGRVVGLRLDGASLSGGINSLFGLARLRVLSLRNNALTGSLPHLVHNGPSPRLRHLFLSGNRLSGSLNISLPNLASLRLENNEFSGGLDGLKLPAIIDFNISSNHFSGGITNLLSKFPASAFEGNCGLCGSPLPACGEISRLTESNGTAISPSPVSLVSRSQSFWSKAGVTVLVAIGATDLLAIAVGVTVIAGMYLWLRRKLVLSQLNSTSGCIPETELDRALEEEKDKERGLSCFEGGEDLRLDCLLKASAEVLGKGLSGSTYKAVLEDGIVVAVKRLSTVKFPSRSKAFDRQMQLIGRARHPNVVSLRAYCNANHERLLVYDYMPNGSLQALLQSSSNRTRLDWTSRKQILMGAAEGLVFIHAYPAARHACVHANVKPSNILVDQHGNSCVAEWGVMRFASSMRRPLACSWTYLPDSAVFAAEGTSAARQGYSAPELEDGKELPTQESDVYSFGMVILEVITDKEIDDTKCQDEVMSMVKIGMLCTAENPEERPKMHQVVKMMSHFL